MTKAGGHKHVMNLGHGTSRSERYITTLLLARADAAVVASLSGVMPSTPEANVAAFFEAARTVHERVRL